MAGLFYIFAMASLGLIVEQSSLTETSSFIYHLQKYFPFFHLALVGPFIFLFTKLELDDTYKFSRKETKHFLLGLWGLIPSILVVGQSILIRTTAVDPSTSLMIEKVILGLERYGEVFLWLVTTSYLVTALGVYHRHKGSPRSIWIRQFLNIFLVFQFGIWLPILLINVSPFRMIIRELGLEYYFIYGPLVALIYWIGLRWAMDAPSLTFKSSTKEQLEKTFPPELIEKCIKELKETMERNELYLDPTINTRQLAAVMGTKEKTITYILNQEMGLNFDEFVNRYRIEYAAREMLGLDHDRTTIEKIARLSGFRSAREFQQVFQSFKEISPKEYMKRHQAEAITD